MAQRTRREFMLGEGSGTGGGPQNLHLGVGPAHPAMHGIIRIAAELDGETIVRADVEIGYLHRAFEKDCEQGGWNNAILSMKRRSSGTGHAAGQVSKPPSRAVITTR